MNSDPVSGLFAIMLIFLIVSGLFSALYVALDAFFSRFKVD